MPPPQPPAHSSELELSFPAPHVLLVAFNRPAALNAATPQMERDMTAVLDWFDDEPSLWVVVLTGNGRLFCAGADLKAWSADQQSGKTDDQAGVIRTVHGFGGVSRRSVSAKPIVAAVNGGAYGGGLEMVVNCDLVVAGADARFAFPEVRRGVMAVQGAIPRLAAIAGHQLASELLLLGKTISATEARDRFGFVNAVVPPAEVVPAAVALAAQLAQNSPDAVQGTKTALLLAQRHNVEETVRVHVWSGASTRVYKGENIKEGLLAFTEKRAPVWKNPARL